MNKEILVVMREYYPNGIQRGNFSDEYLDSITRKFHKGFVVHDHRNPAEALDAAISEAIKQTELEKSENAKWIVMETMTHHVFAADATHDKKWYREKSSDELTVCHRLVWMNGKYRPIGVGDDYQFNG